MIAVVDTGGANLRSVTNALGRLGAQWQLSSDPEVIATADKVILPGVGAAAEAMARLHAAQLVPTLQQLTQPLLGICLGMQILFSSSAEGDVATLGLIPGRVHKLAAAAQVRVPHMGWNSLSQRTEGAALLADISASDCFYFVHSYQAPEGPSVRAWCEHGGLVPAVVQAGQAGQIWGVQFHPEKSQDAGARLLRSFLNL